MARKLASAEACWMCVYVVPFFLFLFSRREWAGRNRFLLCTEVEEAGGGTGGGHVVLACAWHGHEGSGSI
jgi:hypothetical protein